MTGLQYSIVDPPVTYDQWFNNYFIFIFVSLTKYGLNAMGVVMDINQFFSDHTRIGTGIYKSIGQITEVM